MNMITRERLYSRFMELCAIDSEPMRERLMADRLTELLAQLGCSVTEDDAGDRIGGTAGNLIASLPGTGPGDPLLFSCHMDRVAAGSQRFSIIRDRRGTGARTGQALAGAGHVL